LLPQNSTDLFSQIKRSVGEVPTRAPRQGFTIAATCDREELTTFAIQRAIMSDEDHLD
jgi:hypothetical protein